MEYQIANTTETTCFERMKGLNFVKSRKHVSNNTYNDLNKIPLIEQKEKNAKLCDFWNDLTQLRSLIFGTKLNLLLLFVPFGFMSYYLHWTPTAIFFINFFAMIPVANILGDSTECLAEHLGEIIGGLLNATFGNAVEMVVMILALLKSKSYKNEGNYLFADNMLVVVQCSLIGSVFSNSLLVLGCSFLAHGMKHKESTFNTAVTSANVSLLLVSGFAMLLPTPYAAAQNAGGQNDCSTSDSQYSCVTDDQLLVSRAAACLLLAMYGCLLLFVLYTHKHIVDPEFNKQKNIDEQKSIEMAATPRQHKNQFKNVEQIEPSDDFQTKDSKLPTVVLKEHSDSSEHNEENNDDNNESNGDNDDELQMSLVGSLSLLLVSTILVSLLSEYLVDALEPMSEELGMSEAFIGIILLPIIGNAVEHITSIRMALKNKMDISLSIAIGSATQVAMFVVSLSIIVAWGLDLRLALDFDPFEVYLFIYTSIIIFAVTSDGHSNWLEGMMLICLYILIGIAVWNRKFT